jgi:hypothetical protein
VVDALLIVLKGSYNASLSQCLTRRDFFIGFLCFGSMYCSNFALKYVNYPFMVLSKSAKIMPGKRFKEYHMHIVIIIGSIRKVYTMHWSQYILASFITIGLILFNSSKVRE